MLASLAVIGAQDVTPVSATFDTGTGWIDNVILRPPQMVTPDDEMPPVMTDHGMPTPDRR